MSDTIEEGERACFPNPLGAPPPALAGCGNTGLFYSLSSLGVFSDWKLSWGVTH